jgi:hypothetical protein
MQKDRSDFAVMNRMIDHIRLLIALDDETVAGRCRRAPALAQELHPFRLGKRR